MLLRGYKVRVAASEDQVILATQVTASKSAYDQLEVLARTKHHGGITRVLRRGKTAVQAEIDLIAPATASSSLSRRPSPSSRKEGGRSAPSPSETKMGPSPHLGSSDRHPGGMPRRGSGPGNGRAYSFQRSCRPLRC
jgi:hypothetical protein